MVKYSQTSLESLLSHPVSYLGFQGRDLYASSTLTHFTSLQDRACENRSKGEPWILVER